MITITEKIMSNNLLNIFTVGSFRAVFLKKELEKIHSNQFVISLKKIRIWNEFNGFLYSSEKQLFCLTVRSKLLSKNSRFHRFHSLIQKILIFLIFLNFYVLLLI
jgi:hypothetical protein